MKRSIPFALAAAAALFPACSTGSSCSCCDDGATPVAAQDDAAPAPMLTGRVVDGAGAPVADVEVRVYGGLATRWQTGATRTAADGTFSFAEVSGAMTKPDADGPWHQYVGVCAGATVANLNPAAYLPWQDVTIAPGGSEHVELVLDAERVSALIEQERTRRGG